VRDPVTPPPSRDEPAITSPEVTRPPSEAYRPEATDESREEAILQPPVRLFFFAERSGSLLVDEETVAKLVPGTPFAKSFPLDSEFTAKLLDIDGDCVHAPIVHRVTRSSQNLRFDAFNCAPCEGEQPFGADYVAALAFAQDHPECSHNAIVEPPRSAYGQEEYRELLAIQGRSFAALGRWEQAVDAFRESLDFGTDAQVGADLAICETNLKKYGAANEALEVAERSAQLNGAPTEVWEVIRAYRVFVLHGQYKSAPPPTQEGRESYRNQICRAISTYEDRHPGGVNEALVQNVRALVCG
jgi:tetratricopeptide (TPR) repeat protein